MSTVIQSKKRQLFAVIVIPLAVVAVLAMVAALIPFAGGVVLAVHPGTTVFVDVSGPSCPGTGAGTAADPFCTIQEGVTHANAGDTISVAAGTYAEAVTIDKALTLNGAKGGVDARTRDTSSGESILDGGVAPGFGITIGDAVSGVTIDGFEIKDYTNPEFQGGVGSGIMVWRNSGLGQTGANADITILNNYIHDVGWNGVLIGSENFDLIQTGMTIRHNLIKEARQTGIELTNTIESQVLDNKIIAPTVLTWDAGDAGVGIEIAVRAHTGNTRTAGTNVLVAGNEITGAFAAASRAGINLLSRTYSGTSDATLTGVTVSGNTVSGGTNVRAAILAVAESRLGGDATITNLVVASNTLDGNTAGIEIHDFVKSGSGTATHSGITITDNQIINSTGSGVHILTGTSATGITVQLNAIVGNALGINNEGTGTLNAINNFWGKASGPSGQGVGAGDSVSANVTFRPWLLEAGGVVFDETIVLTSAGNWTLFSAPRLLGTAPTVKDDAAGTVSILAFVNGAFITVGDPAFDGDVVKPVSAFFVNAENLAGIGFDFALPTSPGQTSKALTAGWNLIGTNNSAEAQDELSSIQNTSQVGGILTLFVPDTFNDSTRKDLGHIDWAANGDRDLNANPITVLDPVTLPNLSTRDGYWVFLNAARTFSKQLILD